MNSVGNSIGKNLLAPRKVSTRRSKINPQNSALKRQLIAKMSAQGANISVMTSNGPTDHSEFSYFIASYLIFEYNICRKFNRRS